MKQLTRGLQISFAVHAIVFGLIIIAGNSSVMRGSPMVIDFTMEPPPHITASPAAKPTLPASKGHLPAKKEAQKTKLKPVVTKKEPPAVEETEKPLPPLAHEVPTPALAPPVSRAQAPVEESITLAESTAGSEPAASGAVREGGVAQSGDGHPSAASGIGPAGGPGDATEQARTAYIRKNFAYIRDIIMRRLSYPKIARRMGWSGKVIVSFVVCENGEVKDIKICGSSGFDVLDRRAVETIKEVCPLPRPPAKALLKVPIVFRLE
jgi:periplasmic protein TonB